jgi:hypothetical protein
VAAGLLVRPLLDELDDLRTAVVAELAKRVHLGEHVLHRAAPDAADCLPTAPALLVYAHATFCARGMSIDTLKNNTVGQYI